MYIFSASTKCDISLPIHYIIQIVVRLAAADLEITHTHTHWRIYDE